MDGKLLGSPLLRGALALALPGSLDRQYLGGEDAMMADSTKLPHQDNPENPNEDLSDERQRKKAKVESSDEPDPEPEPSNDRKKRAGTPGRPASSGRHR